ncbi:MAG TPA: response regulator, partial [Myxococcaceae bacterium]|nr:response regulator [Myxococcaceae bacterium]
SGVRVLVVEDHPDSRELLQTVLVGAGAEVSAAASVREAMETMQQLKPDVLVSEIEMVDEDGYSLIRRVRELGAERGGQVQAAALTAYARGEDRTQALRAGFQAQVTKPIDVNELVSVVANLAETTRSPMQ